MQRGDERGNLLKHLAAAAVRKEEVNNPRRRRIVGLVQRQKREERRGASKRKKRKGNLRISTGKKGGPAGRRAIDWWEETRETSIRPTRELILLQGRKEVPLGARKKKGNGRGPGRLGWCVKGKKG